MVGLLRSLVTINNNGRYLIKSTKDWYCNSCRSVRMQISVFLTLNVLLGS